MAVGHSVGAFGRCVLQATPVVSPPGPGARLEPVDPRGTLQGPPSS